MSIQSIRPHLLAIAIAFSLALFGATAQAMTSDQALALAKSAYFQKDASSLAKLRAAAESGDANAQFWLGFLYDNGQGVPQDYAQAAFWYRKAADQGNAMAQDSLGVLYHDGHGVPQDYGQALAWLRKAADQGYADAQDSLGFMYDNGRGVPQDYAQAAFWFRKAANQGYAKAQNNLGAMYADGRGVPQDYVIAYALYNLSATGDRSKDNPATSNRTALASRMTEQQIERAQQLTQRMQSIGVLKAINAMPVEKRTAFNQNPGGTSPKSISTTGNSPWPARPEKVPGETTCNTRCINGSCWRTYDNGRHVHLNVAPSVDPFSGNITFNPPPC